MKRQNALDRSNRGGAAKPRLPGRVGLPARMAFTVAALTLTACATAPEPRIITRTVEVPISVPCAVSVTEPTYVDTDEAIAGAPNLYELAKLYAAGRLQRIGALGEYRAAVAGCSQSAAE
jgi:hypothetical protein